MSNAPDRFALFILGPGEKRLEIQEDPRIAHAVSVVLNKEDHTLGNMIRYAVMRQPHVLFCGYQVPHPLEPKVVIRIQTTGDVTPVQTLQAACEQLIANVDATRNQFRQQVVAKLGPAAAAPTAQNAPQPITGFQPDQDYAEGVFVDI